MTAARGATALVRWREIAGPLLARILDERTYPTAARPLMRARLAKRRKNCEVEGRSQLTIGHGCGRWRRTYVLLVGHTS